MNDRTQLEPTDRRRLQGWRPAIGALLLLACGLAATWVAFAPEPTAGSFLPSSQRLSLTALAAGGGLSQPPAPAGSTSALATIRLVRSDLEARSPEGGSAAARAERDLDVAVTSSFWSTTSPDGNHLQAKSGQRVFDAVGAALGRLALLSDRTGQPQWALMDSAYLDYAARLLADTAIADNACAPANPRSLVSARAALAAGDADYAAGRYQLAVDRYRAAWRDAERAAGVCGGATGFTVTPADALFTVNTFLPGDLRTATATVHAGGPGTVTISQSGTVSTPCESGCTAPAGTATDLAHALLLSITDLSTGARLYGGTTGAPLDGLSEVTVCGSKGPGCPDWRAGETHEVAFDVAMPLPLGNDYQGTTAATTFVWTWWPA